MSDQNVFWLEKGFEPVESCINICDARRIFLVCGRSIDNLEIGQYLTLLSQNTAADIIRFSAFEPNPDYRSVIRGVEIFREKRCDLIFAIGGGSAIDVAKCVKLFALSEMPPDELPQSPPLNDIPLFAMPTTAGSGSEATQFAVIYLNGKKQSITDASILPKYVFLDSRALKTLPDYQKKSAMLDALCHAVEAHWSVNSNLYVQAISCSAIRLILDNAEGYIGGDADSAHKIMTAANLAGQAINIARTTAAHAMSYKLTSVFGIAHGHAAFICLLGLISRLSARVELREALDGLSEIIGGEPKKHLSELYLSSGLQTPVCTDVDVIRELAAEVNVERLSNFPVKLTEQEIEDIYRNILGGDLLNER